ncbi:MAG: DUF4406 domain-containing protein [Oceanospirillaceae bacterium]|nr:DUF4406 domain-containing protein [Oceanospirillaceae bacterium]
MKIAYIAHPISGDVKGNLEKIAKIAREINLNEPDVVPFANYFLDCHALDDSKPEERKRGIKNNTHILRSGFVDELRLYGDRISDGMMAEIIIAYLEGIKVIPMTDKIKSEFHYKKHY